MTNSKHKELIDKNKLIRLYNEGLSEREIAKQMNKSRAVIRMRLIEFGIHGNRNGEPENEKIFDRKIVDLYNSGIKDIDKLLNIPKYIINTKLKNLGYPIRYTRIKVKNDFFGSYNPVNCYWAGFVAADGWVENTANIGIELSSVDIQHLCKFAKLIEFTGKIYTRVRLIKDEKKQEMCNIRFISDQIKEDLENNFLITPRKAKTLLPPNISNDLAHHFIRGYIDGDGCYRKDYPSVSIRGTKEMLAWIKEKIRFNCLKVGNPGIKFDTGTYKITFNGAKQFKKITKWLFDGSTKETRLDRKYKKVLEHQKRKIKPFGGAKLTESLVSRLIKEYNDADISQAMLARKHNVNYATLNDILNDKSWKYLDKITGERK